jgi:hypothetical protein
MEAYESFLVTGLARKDWSFTNCALHNIAQSLLEANSAAGAQRVLDILVRSHEFTGSFADHFFGRLLLFGLQSHIGRADEARATWSGLKVTRQLESCCDYHPGAMEEAFARFEFWNGEIQEERMLSAERLAADARNRPTIRRLHNLRGEWAVAQGDWKRAATAFEISVRMARESALPDAIAETGLAFAKFQLRQTADPIAETERLSQFSLPAFRYLAMLWLAIGDRERAQKEALSAYKWAWADGEPYVYRYELNKTLELLNQIGVSPPDLPPYDPSNNLKFSWEDSVNRMIDKLREQRLTRNNAQLARSNAKLI